MGHRGSSGSMESQDHHFHQDQRLSVIVAGQFSSQDERLEVVPRRWWRLYGDRPRSCLSRTACNNPREGEVAMDQSIQKILFLKSMKIIN